MLSSNKKYIIKEREYVIWMGGKGKRGKKYRPNNLNKYKIIIKEEGKLNIGLSEVRKE